MVKHAKTAARPLGGRSRPPRRPSWFIVITLAVALVGGLSAYRAFFSHTAASRTAAAPSSHVASQPKTPNTTAPPAPASTPSPAQLCGQAGWPEAQVDGGAYVVQNDEWNSTAPECITTNGDSQFAVTSSSIYEPANGDPGGYPSIFSGCSAGVCTAGNKMPIRVGDLGPGMVTSSWATTQPPGGAYDVAYDIWFNETSATSGAPDGGELMIWLAHRGGSQISPAGAPVAQVTIGGYAYTVWLYRDNPGSGPAYDRIAYVMDRATRSVQDLDVGAIAADAARRGYLADASYLLNVQAGFEIWQGGSGLKTQSFALNIGK